MFTTDRRQLREFFFTVFKQYQEQQPLGPLEQQVLAVILEHPEYHDLLNQPNRYLEKDYLPEFGETNPFFHMSLHLGLREQISTNRPAGIRDIFSAYQQKYGGDSLAAEHEMMDCLVESLWQAQRDGAMPDEATYLQQLRERIK